MATKFTGGIDLATGEVQNACFQNLPGAPAAKTGRFYFNTVSTTLEYHNGSTWIAVGDAVAKATFDANTILKADADNTPVALTVNADTIVGRVTGVNGDVISALTATQTRTFLGSLDLFTAPAAPLSMGGQTITNVGTPVLDTDAATKAYVDATAQGLDIKTAVRVASVVNVDLTGAVPAIDGITLAAGDRVLLKDQALAYQNGIYVMGGATPILTRAQDANTSAEVRPGMFCFVTEGTANHDKGFVLTTDAPIILDATNLTFTQFSGAGSVTGTTDRITVTGSQVDIAATYTGQTSITTLGTVTTGTWQGTAVGVLYGGTGATTAADARANLGAIGRVTATIGNGVDTSFTVTHNFGSLGIVVELYEVATGQTVYADVTRTSINAISVSGFTIVPTTNQYAVVILG